jgi:hypothetical protein
MFFAALALSLLTLLGYGLWTWGYAKLTKHRFNSSLYLQVWVVRMGGGASWPFRSSEHADYPQRIVVGYTPSSTPIAIPECLSWGVKAQPSQWRYWGKCEWTELALLIDQEQMPGLELAGEANDEGLAAIRGCTSLRQLSLANSSVTDAGMVYLKDLNRLETLNLEGTRLTGVGLAQLKGLKNLRIIRLGESSVTGDGLAALKELTSLEELNLAGAKNLSDADVPQLKQLTQLKDLNIDGTRISANGGSELWQAMWKRERPSP